MLKPLLVGGFFLCAFTQSVIHADAKLVENDATSVLMTGVENMAKGNPV